MVHIRFLSSITDYKYDTWDAFNQEWIVLWVNDEVPSQSQWEDWEVSQQATSYIEID